jgi:predicted DNA binding CopG/RHH family protein
MTTAPKKPLSFKMDDAAAPPAAALRPVPAAANAEQRQQVGARITATTYRQLKSRAALKGVTVQTLVETAITEYLTRQTD